MTPSERRRALLEWMRQRLREPASGVEVWSRCSLYPLMNTYEQDRKVMAALERDLRILEKEGLVRRLPGRPARWEAV